MLLNSAISLLCSRAALVIVAAIALGPQHARAQSISLETFGAHIHHDHASSVDGAWGLKFGWLRLHDSGVNWKNLEPARSVWNFRLLDEIMYRAETKGAKVLFTFGATPSWAAEDQSADGAYGAASASLPYDREWRNHVETIVTRYKGRISAYEIWNEPDLAKFFRGTPADLANLHVAACEIIRREDPAAQIVSAGGSPRRADFFSRYLSLLPSRCVDVLGVHLYTANGAPPEALPMLVADFRAAVPLRLRYLPVWNTEIGWLVRTNGRKGDAQAVGFNADAVRLDRQELSSVIIRTFILLASLGVEKTFWYSMNNAEMGIVGGPAQLAWQRAVDLLAGHSVERCRREAALWRCRLNASADELVWAAFPGSSLWPPNLVGGTAVSITDDICFLIDLERTKVPPGAVLIVRS